MSLIAYCIGNPLFSGPALVTQCEQMTNWLRINILLILERRIEGIWHLRISFIFRVHTQAAGYSSKENLFKTSPSLLNRVHVKGESATPHQTTETFPVGPLNTPSRARRYNRGKEEKKKKNVLSHVQISRFLAPHPRTKTALLCGQQHAVQETR